MKSEIDLSNRKNLFQIIFEIIIVVIYIVFFEKIQSTQSTFATILISIMVLAFFLRIIWHIAGVRIVKIKDNNITSIYKIFSIKIKKEYSIKNIKSPQITRSIFNFYRSFGGLRVQGNNNFKIVFTYNSKKHAILNLSEKNAETILKEFRKFKAQ